jgi:hypothetical protein
MIEALLMLLIAVVGAASFLILRKRDTHELKVDQFQTKWQELQKMCSDKTKWTSAVDAADHLLDEALRKKHIRGKSMGERLVHAQRMFTNNDGVWFGHKLRNRVESEPDMKLKEADVKDALIGIRQGLKDLGALPEVKKADDK